MQIKEYEKYNSNINQINNNTSNHSFTDKVEVAQSIPNQQLYDTTKWRNSTQA